MNRKSEYINFKKISRQIHPNLFCPKWNECFCQVIVLCIFVIYYNFFKYEMININVFNRFAFVYSFLWQPVIPLVPLLLFTGSFFLPFSDFILVYCRGLQCPNSPSPFGRQGRNPGDWMLKGSQWKGGMLDGNKRLHAVAKRNTSKLVSRLLQYHFFN